MKAFLPRSYQELIGGVLAVIVTLAVIVNFSLCRVMPQQLEFVWYLVIGAYFGGNLTKVGQPSSGKEVS